ncbi:M20/M25/M40 family metallo-hydrolase [Sulfitobacter geojensis]|uniref:M20/M25/M40 family metallo-hydrolase n=1 Tax=Sulfitobacter geojensis TaxID=1342299 RepID=A0AAE2W105_9RHOB|nr:M20/M25/M40 family metallo-hydrolase [Sulfitobacter geojensis]MBM1690815.1 M20/M25/M40 family metallo-hydrolase [Sulfitobacter geojensis]MBM1694881.1 M20/M25/M40 family metallo-hydrolase [Sulfitobacter geojensis]MBM1706965.1 M20/M25/M40 family metallo-hydrolase [Sulfitobacter geojensis]MBM1711023.1 M20/M25/M40 family metallo-hydrolase [Sulfitobacter geojensis]MBM1715089.1 M20/M25/M40 family metallo-hydrolase [Sulfitobacter geojensis]
MSDPVVTHALAHETQLIEDLKTLVAFPSVGADPAMAQGMEDARVFIEQRIAAMGFQNTQRLTPPDGSGHAALYGERMDAPGKPTMLIYAHYDVQPADPLEKWNTPPFTATEADGKLFGRGISDDKAPMMIALDTLAAFIAVEGRLPINVKLLIEGEEETGSPSLIGILETHRDLLAADAVLSADGARWRPDLVALNVGSRGNTGFEMRVQTATQDLHSGRFGGIVANPLHVMSKLVASLHDADGRIAATGFYDGVTEPTQAERAELAAIPSNDANTFGAIDAAPHGEAGYSTLERLWMRPTLDVNGMWGGYIGAGSKTVIPNEAFAKITMRLVPGQVPQKAKQAVLDHLNAQLPDYATLDIYGERGQGGAYAVPPEHPLLGAAVTALQKTSGQVPLKVRIGASLPLTEIVHRILGMDTVMFSFSLSDENFHAPNEFFRLSSITDGLAAWVQIIREIAEIDRADFAPYRRL